MRVRNINKIKEMKKFKFNVYSGLDAFEIKSADGTMIYLPFIQIIAETKEKARELTAKLLGQKLEDQETNTSYLNYISKDVELIGEF